MSVRKGRTAAAVAVISAAIIMLIIMMLLVRGEKCDAVGYTADDVGFTVSEISKDAAAGSIGREIIRKSDLGIYKVRGPEKKWLAGPGTVQGTAVDQVSLNRVISGVTRIANEGPAAYTEVPVCLRIEPLANAGVVLKVRIANSDDTSVKISKRQIAGPGKCNNKSAGISGRKLSQPGDPTKPGYAFAGWYHMTPGGIWTQWDFENDRVYGPLNLKASWIAYQPPQPPVIHDVPVSIKDSGRTSAFFNTIHTSLQKDGSRSAGQWVRIFAYSLVPIFLAVMALSLCYDIMTVRWYHRMRRNKIRGNGQL